MKFKFEISMTEYRLIMDTLYNLVPHANYLLLQDSKNKQDYEFYLKQYIALDLLLNLFKHP